MKVITFDLVGPFAHFRPFYTNTNSLTYGFPPRTTISGIIAGLLGMERDSYYRVLSPEVSRISVRVISPVRKLMQKVNYINTKDEKWKFMKPHESTQVPIEILLPARGDVLRYRIFFHHSDEDFMRRLMDALNRGGKYHIYLGITEFLAWTENPKMLEGKMERTREIHSVIPGEYIKLVDFSRSRMLIIDRMPIHFQMDGAFRRLAKGYGVGDYAFDPRGEPIILKEEVEALKVGESNILWMERNDVPVPPR